MEGYSRIIMETGNINSEETELGNSFQKIFEYELSKVSVGKGGLLDFDAINSCGITSLTARSEIPPSHRLIADNYMMMKKYYGSPVIKGKLSDKEIALLKRYDFKKLEYCTGRQINEELAFLQSGAVSRDKNLRDDCDAILKIRLKELRFLAASKYIGVSNEMFNGYTTLEQYFELISSYGGGSKNS